MLITLAKIKNYKRIRDVEIRPEADGHLLLLGGANMQGKTSILDAIDAALGGKRAQAVDPVRHGADSSEIVIELGDGALTVKRTIAPDGETTLEVRDRDGAVRSPQAILDKLLGARFLDPLAFIRQSAAEQRAMLLRLIDPENKLLEIDVRRGRIFDKRTEVGRDLKKAEGELARHETIKVAEPIDVAALAAERAAFSDQQRAGDGAGAHHAKCVRDVDEAKATLDRTTRERQALEGEIERLQGRVAGMQSLARDQAAAIEPLRAAEQTARETLERIVAEWAATADRRARLDADLKRADEHNRAVFAADAGNKRRVEASDTVAKLAKQRDEQTAMIEKIDAQKLAVLTAAKLPVDGLGVDETGVTFNGVPFVQSSGAEKLRVAMALAMAMSSGLDDVLIRDAALLDDDSLKLVGELAEAAGKRAWLERVGTRDPGVIVIKDGEVQS
jgi:DNA repair ATPase RecN